MREIRLSPTRGHNGAPAEENPPLRVYDTSGPYTDPQVTTDVRQGLPRLREAGAASLRASSRFVMLVRRT